MKYRAVLHKALAVRDEIHEFTAAISIPIMPYPGLGIRCGDIEDEIEEVVWDNNKEEFQLYVTSISLEPEVGEDALTAEDAITHFIDMGWVLTVDPVETNEPLEEGLQALDEGSTSDEGL